MNKLSRLILSLGILQLLLVILSWLLSAMRVEGVRSLLSGEGIRWFIGGFTGMLLQPLLAWLLLLLIENQGRVLTREVLMDRIWGLGAERENRTLDVHIRTLRAKLGNAGNYIQTVRGVGYVIKARP